MIISLEGLPGAGKTTTAKLIAEMRGWEYHHERSADHPFLDAFYSDIERYKFETELCFLLLHYHQLRDLDPARPIVLDYSPVKDLIFADLNLREVDYDLFVSLYERTSGSLPLPDVAVFLELGLDHTLDRIQKRGRKYEQDIEPEYIRSLGDAYQARYSGLGQRVELVKVAPTATRDDIASAVSAVLG